MRPEPINGSQPTERQKSMTHAYHHFNLNEYEAGATDNEIQLHATMLHF